MAYLLDANVLIQAKNLHYGLDFCPAFWSWLVLENEAGRLYSIEKVGDEVEAGGDELATWASDRGAGFFLRPDTAMLPMLGRVSTWAASQPYEPAAVNTFLQKADYYLVAHALAHQHIVVTHEIASTSVRKIKIPDACMEPTGLKVARIGNSRGVRIPAKILERYQIGRWARRDPVGRRNASEGGGARSRVPPGVPTQGMKRYEIRWAKTRPAVIVSLDVLNGHLQTVTICPLTTQLHPAWRTRLGRRVAGRKAEIAVDQIRTIGKTRLGRKLGALSSDHARALRRLITEMYGE